jgi:hypothetical protein
VLLLINVINLVPAVLLPANAPIKTKRITLLAMITMPVPRATTVKLGFASQGKQRLALRLTSAIWRVNAINTLDSAALPTRRTELLAMTIMLVQVAIPARAAAVNQARRSNVLLLINVTNRVNAINIVANAAVYRRTMVLLVMTTTLARLMINVKTDTVRAHRCNAPRQINVINLALVISSLANAPTR